MRIGMIGAGFIAKANGGALLQIPDVELAAVSNRTTEKAEKLLEDFGISCPVYQDYHEMLAKEKLDAVLINLAHHLHLESFITCAKAGLNIIIEKALANSYQDCLKMIESAKQYGIKATVCHTQRYNAVYEEAAKFLKKNDLGPLLSISDNIHTHYFWEGRSPWHLSQKESGGGIVLNYGVHQLDRVHFFLNQKTVNFQAEYLARKPGYEIYSSYTMMGLGDKGTPYIISCTGYTGPSTNETRLVFERGILQCCLVENGVHPFGFFFGDNKSKTYQPIPLSMSNDKMFVREMQAAIDYFSGKTNEAPVPLEWGAEMVRLVEQGHKKNKS